MTAYQQQLADKKQYLQQLFQGLDFPEIEVFESPEQHYRMRAEFRIWHEGGEMFYAMFERGQKASGASLIRCDQFPAASESINALMPKLIEAASNHPKLKNRWYAVEFLSTLSGEMLVTMIYHKKLNEAWQQAAQELAHNLGIRIIGRSRGQKNRIEPRFRNRSIGSQRQNLPLPSNRRQLYPTQCPSVPKNADVGV